MAHPTYFVKGHGRVPSVTTVLGLWGEKEGLLHWAWQLGIDGKNFREERGRAAGIGTAVHAMVEADIKGLAQTPLTPEALGVPDGDPAFAEMAQAAQDAYLAYVSWREMTKIELIVTEFSMVSPTHFFGGTFDAVGVVNGELVLADVKTSNRLYHTYVAQVAAYCHLWRFGVPLTLGPVPPRLGEPIKSAHLLRFDKTHGTFTHVHLPRPVIEKGWTLFETLRKAYDADKALKGAA